MSTLRINTFLDLVIRQGGSDLHLVAGNPPRIRMHGVAYPVKYRELNAEEVYELIHDLIPQKCHEEFVNKGNTDFSYAFNDEMRFRVNVFQHLGGMGAVFRAIPNKIPALNQLGLPPIIKNLTRLRRGLILVTGPTGSGKSTTLAAMIDQINTDRKGHIITIEDPVEFIHKTRNCLFSQREVGTHVASFSRALLSALREDPDVILVGEMRDPETIHLAITAAEIGILVFATLHTNGAAASIDRIVNAFPAGEEPYVRTMLSTSLIGIVSQQLARRADAKGRLAAVEVLINNSAVANLIRENKIDQIENVIQSGGMQGMQRLDTALRRLLDANLISAEEAYFKARNKTDFEALVKGKKSVNPPGQAPSPHDSVNL
ncbi:MAG: type IV pilus twitching motility protein PilT [Gammaproteobacteria bacterium]|nr:type IV pilus twitching motility protein PilT [Gammaproteobacteria bacterium]